MISVIEGAAGHAHVYVRFLGDVSGGQIVARAVRDVYGAVGARATAFYDFRAVGPAPRFRTRYRDRLDAAPVPDVAALAPAAPRALCDALARCLAKDPAERWPSARAFADAVTGHASPGGRQRPRRFGVLDLVRAVVRG